MKVVIYDTIGIGFDREISTTTDGVDPETVIVDRYTFNVGIMELGLDSGHDFTIYSRKCDTPTREIIDHIKSKKPDILIVELSSPIEMQVNAPFKIRYDKRMNQLTLVRVDRINIEVPYRINCCHCDQCCGCKLKCKVPCKNPITHICNDKRSMDDKCAELVKHKNSLRLRKLVRYYVRRYNNERLRDQEIKRMFYVFITVFLIITAVITAIIFICKN